MFYDLLKQIGEHLIKVTRLKENEDREGHCDEEIVDIFFEEIGLKRVATSLARLEIMT